MSDNVKKIVYGLLLLVLIALLGLLYGQHEDTPPSEQTLTEEPETGACDRASYIEKLNSPLTKIRDMVNATPLTFSTPTTNNFNEYLNKITPSVTALDITNLKDIYNQFDNIVDTKLTELKEKTGGTSEARRLKLTTISGELSTLNGVIDELEQIDCKDNSVDSINVKKLSKVIKEHDSALEKLKTQTEADLKAIQELQKNSSLVYIMVGIAFVLTLGCIAFLLFINTYLEKLMSAYKLLQNSDASKLIGFKQQLNSLKEQTVNSRNNLALTQESLEATKVTLANLQAALAALSVKVNAPLSNPPINAAETSTLLTLPYQDASPAKSLPIDANDYFTFAPNSDSCFDTKDFSEQMTRDVLYKISFASNDSVAGFEFINQPDIVNSAIRYPEDMLYRACENENAFNRDATRIITVQKGEAVRQGDRWRITQKAKIRYDV